MAPFSSKTSQDLESKASIFLVREPTPSSADEPQRFCEMQLMCKAGAKAADAQKYKKKFRMFEDGSPQDYIDAREGIAEIWKQNGVFVPEDRVAIVNMLIVGGSQVTFESSLADQQADPTALGNQLALTREMVDKALAAVALDVFRDRALFYQKRWIEHSMKKPINLSTRRMVAAFTKMNEALGYFPGATAASKYSDADKLERMEWAVPQFFRDAFEKKGYVPSDHNMKRFIEECEIIERQQNKDTKKKEREDKKKNKRSNSKSPSQDGKTKDKKSDKKYFCDHHGANNTHDSDSCFVLHPELKSNKKPKKSAKESHSMELCAMSKDEAKSRMRELGSYLLKLKEQEKKKKTIRFAKETEISESDDSSTDEESISAIERRIPKKSKKRKANHEDFSPEELEFQRKCKAMNSSSDDDSA